MRYCFNCSRTTAGQPLFCNFCGRTFNVKLCNRLHENPREAQVCGQCGSREFTTPQPKLRLWMRPLLYLLSILPGMVLLLVTVGYMLVYLYIWITRPSEMLPVMLIGLLVGALWLLYVWLPSWGRRSVRRVLHRRNK